MRRSVLFFVVTAFLALICSDAFAKDMDKTESGLVPPFRHEIRLGWGGAPLFHMMLVGSGWNEKTYGMYGNLASDLYGEFRGPIYMTGNISLEYSYSFKKWFALSANIGMNGIYSRRYDKVTGLNTGLDFGAALSLFPQARFSYLNREYVKLYSALGAGITVKAFQDYTELLPVFNFVPLGIAAGRRVYGFFELCAGTVIIGCSAGVGVRF